MALFLYNDQFLGYDYILNWFCFIYIFMFLGVIYRIALRTIENTKAIFYSQILSTIFTVSLAYYLTKSFGLIGSLAALLAVYVSVFLFLYISFITSTKQAKLGRVHD